MMVHSVWFIHIYQHGMPLVSAQPIERHCEQMRGLAPVPTAILAAHQKETLNHNNVR